MPVNVIITLVVLLICILVGFKTKINIGLISIAGAFVVGTLVMGVAPNDVLNDWDISLFITLFSITMFFGIATSNGTLRTISLYIIYPFRNYPKILPFILFGVAALIAGIGPGSIAATAMLAPIYMSICKEMKMKYIMVPIMLGSVSPGAWAPISLNGQLCRTNLINAGFDATVAGDITNRMMVAMIIPAVLTLIIGYFLCGAFRAQKIKMEKPAGFTETQKKTLLLIGIMIFFVGVIPVLGTVIHAAWFTTFKSWIHIYMMCVLLSVAAIFMKVTDTKGLISNVRWDTIIMVCGTSILVALARQAGMVEYLTAQLANMASSMLTTTVSLVSGVLSFFTSTLVVMPTVMPIIQGLTITAGASGAVLNCAMITSAVVAGFSPLSLIGSLVMAGLDKSEDESTSRKLFVQLWILAILSAVLSVALAALGVWNIFA